MSTNRIYLVHGFNVSDGGAGSIGRLAEPLQEAGLKTHPLRYGWWGLLMSRFGNMGLSQAIGDMMDEGDAFVAHSNGCDLVRRLSWMDVPPFSAVLINPALDRDTDFGPRLNQALVMYNRCDWAVWLARWLIMHPWGAMGRKGYKGNDPRIDNLDCWPMAKGHSGVFRRPEYWSKIIVGYLHPQASGKNSPMPQRTNQNPICRPVQDSS